jgi:SAM-dependent methyltransferase
MQQTHCSNRTSYVIDPASAIEHVRLYDQHRLMTRVAGGLFPKDLTLESVSSVLDLACGTGEWVCDVAHTLEVPCVGVDLSTWVLLSARASAKMQGLDDLVTFQQMDVTQPFDFPDHSFDLVNARFLADVLPRACWPTVLQEGLRVLKPGGSVVVTEAEWATTTSPAAQHLAHVALEAFWKAGQGFSVTGRELGVVHALPALLKGSGAHHVQVESFVLDCSYGQPHYTAMVRHLWATYLLMQPFLTQMGYGSQEELYAYCDRFAQQCREESFQGGMVLLRAWGGKSDEPEREDFFLPPSFPSLSR